MTAKPPEPSRDMWDELDYREPWDPAGSTDSPCKQGPHSREFHFREAGVRRFNDIVDWDDDDH
ncbi:hypothetical protein OAZ24_05480 [Synechococcus sp. AH-736-G21]|nr:hypothetical protein [Synechococcus sp. AH-736-G21]